MNPITNGLPALLDGALADFAQATGRIGYGDIIDLGKAWDGLDAGTIRGILALLDAYLDECGECGEPQAAQLLAEAVKAAANDVPSCTPPVRAGDLVLYRNGSGYELGLVKRVTDDGAFVYYSEGDTAAKTPFANLSGIGNAFTVRAVTLGGRETTLENGHAKEGAV